MGNGCHTSRVNSRYQTASEVRQPLESAESPARTAVVVEDEPFVRMEIAEALADAGWHVVEVSSGEAALALLGQRPCVRLLVTDIRLAGRINGWDVAEKYRETLGNIAVIYCSGNPANRERQVRDSVFLPKPCRMDLLVRASESRCLAGSATAWQNHSPNL